MGKLQDRVAILVNIAWGGGGGLGRVEYETDETMDHNTLFVGGGTHINGSAWAPELPDDA